MPLTPKQRQAFKAQAHSLKPVILLGAKGLTEAVIAETEQALLAHELIKIKLAGVEREDKSELCIEIANRLHAEIVQTIGNILVLYRQNPDR